MVMSSFCFTVLFLSLVLTLFPCDIGPMEDEGPGLGVKEGILGSSLMAGQGKVVRHGGGAWDTTRLAVMVVRETGDGTDGEGAGKTFAVLC